ncbi:hypothetical protein RRG08_044367 [Elysia crispata]|uniref:Uncharacterized protein n=1 Tax=Elysia crispata TaxID=231223 RepID=A0AAE1DUM4_9GAST|nr:hypothetical protein RRG08_044367 [Elysia crispata]
MGVYFGDVKIRSLSSSDGKNDNKKKTATAQEQAFVLFSYTSFCLLQELDRRGWGTPRGLAKNRAVGFVLWILISHQILISIHSMKIQKDRKTNDVMLSREETLHLFTAAALQTVSRLLRPLEEGGK